MIFGKSWNRYTSHKAFPSDIFKEGDVFYIMALFLVTCVIDEGVYESSFRVVKASSREAVAQYILTNYESWKDFISRSIFSNTTGLSIYLQFGNVFDIPAALETQSINLIFGLFWI